MTQQELILSELAQTRKEIAELRSLLLTLSGKNPDGAKPTRKDKISSYKSKRAQYHLKKNIS